MGQQPSKPEYEDIEFEIVNEGWNEYELEDGTKIRMRSVIIEVQKRVGSEKDYRVKTHDIVVVIPALGLVGPPSDVELPAQEYLKMKKQIIRVVGDPKEPWSQYSLPDGHSFKLRMILSNVYRIEGQYDKEGRQRYVTLSTTLVTPI